MDDVIGIDPAVVGEVERETSELLSALIRIDTSNPPGNETKVAEFMSGVVPGARARGGDRRRARRPRELRTAR